MNEILRRIAEQSSFVFVLGFALSVAAFVDSLAMGRDALNFLFLQLSEIQGFRDIANFIGALIHGVLEWWRAVVSQLLRLLGIEIFEWLQQPLSVAFFVASRAIALGVAEYSNKQYDRDLIGEGTRDTTDWLVRELN